jgi:hypothetical protein
MCSSTIGYLSPVEFERKVGKPGVHQTGSSSERVVENAGHMGDCVSNSLIGGPHEFLDLIATDSKSGSGLGSMRPKG